MYKQYNELWTEIGFVKEKLHTVFLVLIGFPAVLWRHVNPPRSIISLLAFQSSANSFSRLEQSYHIACSFSFLFLPFPLLQRPDRA